MESKWRGNNQFLHIGDDVLRSWNQSSIFYNLIGEQGLNVAKEYVKSLPHADRVLIKSRFQEIRAEGYEMVRARVNRELQAREVIA